MNHYFRVWVRLAGLDFSKIYSTSRFDSLFLIAGKLTRFVFFLIFIISLLTHTKNVAGYSLTPMVFFFLTFNFIDLTAQFFLRGIYNIRWYIQSGFVDLVLTQPINFFFRIASDWIDFLDFIVLIPITIALALVMVGLPGFSILSFASYLLLIANAFLIALAIHMIVFGISLVSQETSGEIWIYRDLMTIGRFPVDIFPGGLRFFLTYVAPIGIMISFPTKALIGTLSPGLILVSCSIGIVFFVSGYLFFKHSLKSYSSISS